MAAYFRIRIVPSESQISADMLKLVNSLINKFNSDYYEVFPISTQNYTTFYNRKNVEAYRLFFQKYYH